MNWSERHLLVFCIDPIVPGFVVYYLNIYLFSSSCLCLLAVSVLYVEKKNQNKYYVIFLKFYTSQIAVSTYVICTQDSNVKIMNFRRIATFFHGYCKKKKMIYLCLILTMRFSHRFVNCKTIPAALHNSSSVLKLFLIQHSFWH